jgi:hypothetical protein
MLPVCVTWFNEQIEEIEHWRSSVIVGFSAARLRAESREAELNQAIVDLSREDFWAGNFDLKALFSLLFDRFYSEDFVLWLGAQEAVCARENSSPAMRISARYDVGRLLLSRSFWKGRSRGENE